MARGTLPTVAGTHGEVAETERLEKAGALFVLGFGFGAVANVVADCALLFMVEFGGWEENVGKTTAADFSAGVMVRGQTPLSSLWGFP